MDCPTDSEVCRRKAEHYLVEASACADPDARRALLLLVRYWLARSERGELPAQQPMVATVADRR